MYSWRDLKFQGPYTENESSDPGSKNSLLLEQGGVSDRQTWGRERVRYAVWEARARRKSTLNIHWKDWCWSWSSNILATWWEEPTHWKRPRCWERLMEGREGDDRGWNGWMASLTQWPWVWTNSGTQWRTGSLACCSLWGRKESMGSLRHDRATEQQLNE